MLRGSLPARCAATAAAAIESRWSRDLVSFAGAPRVRACATMSELVAPRLPPDALPAFVIPDVISEADAALVHDVYQRRLFDRLPYSDGHVDALISSYKEFYRSERDLHERPIPELADAPERDETQAAVRRVLTTCRALAQAHSPSVPLADRVHMLQLDAAGVIKAHADEERNSSSIVAGLTLGSARVMTLTHPRDPGAGFVELLLLPRSLYVLAGPARYEWFHSVDEAATAGGASGTSIPAPVPGEPIWFRGAPLPDHRRRMRTAVIWRGVSPRELFERRIGKPLTTL
jgi:hypothetical protein